MKHYMHGLTQIHLQKRGVVLRVKMAEDILYNEVSIFMISVLVLPCTIVVHHAVLHCNILLTQF